MNGSQKRKTIIMILFAAVLLLMVRTIPQIALSERALVVGLGIDYEDGEYSVTAQVIKPMQSGQSDSTDDGYGMATATGKTVDEALGKIGVSLGLRVSINQCNLVVFGKGMTATELLPALNHLMEAHRIPEQAVLAYTDKTAVELLRTVAVMTSISAFQMQQTLSLYDNSDSVTVTNIKSFMSSFLSRSEAAAFTYITVSPVDKGDTQPSQEDGGLGEFNYTKTIVFPRDGDPLLLDDNGTYALNIVLDKVKTGSLSVDLDETTYTLTLNKKKDKIKAQLADGRLQYGVELEFEFFLADTTRNDNFVSTSVIPDDLRDKIQRAAAEEIYSRVNQAFIQCRDARVDAFLINEKAYSAEGEKWAQLAGDDYLSLVDLRLAVTVELTA